jgi:hypothetical protein
METNKKLLSILTQMLIDELTEGSQNFFRQRNVEYSEDIEIETAEVLKQAEWLIKRIIFLEVYKNKQRSIEANHNDLKDFNEKKVNVA